MVFESGSEIRNSYSNERNCKIEFILKRSRLQHT